MILACLAGRYWHYLRIWLFMSIQGYFVCGYYSGVGLIVFLLFHIQNIYSMKRKTVNAITLPEPLRSLKKNKSCLVGPSFNRKPHKHRKGIKDFVCSGTVVDLLIGEWLQSLEEQLKASDQRRFSLSLLGIVEDSSNALSNMLDPISHENKTNMGNQPAENEPQPASVDLFCGGNTIALQGKVNKMPRISIALIEEQKREISQLNQLSTSKTNISSKCLMKTPKEQIQERRLGLQPLKDEQPSQRDTFEDLLREKICKQQKNLFFAQEKHETKMSALPSIEEYSFDYDGSIFPLKKTSVQSSHRIKILNTTCRVLNRDYLDHRKQSIIGRFPPVHLKTESDQPQKENLKVFARGLPQRRESNSASTRELLRICTESDEMAYKTRIEQAVGGRFAKLRELKGR